MKSKAKIFMSGRSQAIRLPAKLRLDAEEVMIEKVGNSMWLQPKSESRHNLGQWLQDFYSNFEPLPDDFLVDRQDSPPQERDWG